MKKAEKKGRVGASFDDFLREEGIYEEVTARANSGAKLRRQKSPRRVGQISLARQPRGKA
jgi:hypothetical protein